MATNIDIQSTLEMLKLTAAAQVEQFPQYAGHFANYRLALIKRNIRTKMGLAFVRGEYVIAVESPAVVRDGVVELDARITAWSQRNRCDTSVRISDVEWVS